MHPGRELDQEAFTQTSTAVAFMGATNYFARLSAIRRGI
jgi:hypothetical protein